MVTYNNLALLLKNVNEYLSLFRKKRAEDVVDKCLQSTEKIINVIIKQ